MSSTSLPFAPPSEMDLYCRFCDKTGPAHLDRSIADSGKTVNRNSTFEYSCLKCDRTRCFSGTNLIEAASGAPPEKTVREYHPKESYLLGEKIFHKKFKDTGMVVGKDVGDIQRILVQFDKNGLKKLIETA